MTWRGSGVQVPQRPRRSSVLADFLSYGVWLRQTSHCPEVRRGFYTVPTGPLRSCRSSARPDQRNFQNLVTPGDKYCRPGSRDLVPPARHHGCAGSSSRGPWPPCGAQHLRSWRRFRRHLCASACHRVSPPPSGHKGHRLRRRGLHAPNAESQAATPESLF